MRQNHCYVNVADGRSESPMLVLIDLLNNEREYLTRALSEWNLQGLPKTQSMYASMLHRKAVVHQNLGDLPTAIECQYQTLEIWRQMHGEASSHTANAMSSLGIFLNQAGYSKQANAFFIRAVRILEAFGDDSDADNLSYMKSQIRDTTGRKSRSSLQKQIRYCCSIICSNKETSSITFQKCARCNVACYCSRSCQKSAWQYHKNFCGQF